MRSISGKEFAQKLEQNGWRLLGINSSHHIYEKPNNPAQFLYQFRAINP